MNELNFVTTDWGIHIKEIDTIRNAAKKLAGIKDISNRIGFLKETLQLLKSSNKKEFFK